MAEQGLSAERSTRDFVPERADFVLARMKNDDISRRQIATLTGIRRSKVHSILHSEPDKRGPMRIDEWHAILEVLKISRLEATFAIELIETDSSLSVEEISSIAGLMTELYRGLPQELVDMMRHIHGLDHGDVRKEHGGTVRRLLIQFLTTHYQNLVDRRDIRETNINL